MDETTKPDIETFIMDDSETARVERYDHATYLLSELLGCDTEDVDAIMDMMRTHDDLLPQTREYIDEVDTSWSFGAFVSGIERRVLNEISDRISEDLHEGLCEVRIDKNHAAWGRVWDSGDTPLPVAEIFAEMCKEGVTDERVERLIRTDREIAEGTERAEQIAKATEGE